MRAARFLGFGAALLMVGVNHGVTFAQGNQGQATPAAQYFGGHLLQNQPIARTARNQVPAPQPVQTYGSKPFEYIQQQPTLSPYLSLDLIPETGTSVPNYHAFVRPQIEQRKDHETQTRELQRLRQQMRAATAQGIISKNPTGGMPTTGHSSQFMNMGSYFPGAR